MPRVWFITGCSRGLGLALVKAVLESGDIVIATARNASSLNSIVKEYGTDRILALSLDVTKEDQVHKTVNQAKAAFGRIDLVVNNAGYAEISPIEDVSFDSFRAQMETNFFGVVHVTKSILPILRQQRSGHILQVSSVGSRVGSPGLAAYQSAKWAIGGFSTVLSKELAPFGVKVTVLEPGGMKTDWAGSSMVEGPLSEFYKQTVGASKKARLKLSAGWPDPDAYARAIVYVSHIADPPLRLLLGSDTVELAKQASSDLAASDAKWHDLTTLNLVSQE
ncbi:hypothetical protein ABVK25_008559 [Lepraria finkii]|uniref:Ketoreductase domain-containing protein n=1 Tax=Lepraria finkii TaxID=1340010 RepID=A0ABR4B088_9LECA